MPTMKEIIWLAGLLEGEGCFTALTNGSPMIALAMNDRDVIEHARSIMGITSKITMFLTKANNEHYRTTLIGRDAIAWMFMLFPFMHARRKQKIGKVVANWRSRPAHPNWRHPSKPRAPSLHAPAIFDHKAYYQANKEHYRKYYTENKAHIKEVRRNHQTKELRARIVEAIEAVNKELALEESPCL